MSVGCAVRAADFGYLPHPNRYASGNCGYDARTVFGGGGFALPGSDASGDAVKK